MNAQTGLDRQNETLAAIVRRVAEGEMSDAGHTALREDARKAIATSSPTPAGGEVRALREALEPFADAVHGLSDRVADDAAILLTIDGRPVVTFAWVKAGDFRRARSVFTGHPADAAQAGETRKYSYGELLICEALEHHFGERPEDYDEDVDDNSPQAAWEAFDALVFGPAPRPAPTLSREEEPTDEQVERALAEWSKPNERREPSEIMRAALKAAGPSAQQRVSEEMVERARKNLAASGIWVSAHGVMQVLEAALSPENGGA